MASIQARHGRSCAIGKPWSPTGKLEGCDCDPTYYIVVREGTKLHRERAGKNRRQAERALTKIQGQEDDGAYVAQKNIRFRDWGKRWLESSERKGSTRAAYSQSIDYGDVVFGDRMVRRIRPEDIGRLNVAMREAGLSASTRNRHLRALGTCFSSAMTHGYGARNPVRDLPDGERPRPAKKEAGYFENDEIPCLFEHFADGVFRVLCLAAMKTGMRQGELCALTWGDIDLQGAAIRVRKNYSSGELTTTKTHEARDVDLTADVVEMLGRCWGESGSPDDDRLVFPGGGKDGYMPGSNVILRVLYDTMDPAEVPRVGPTGEKRTFHSFRHTFAKRALESGAQVTWLSRHLGHSTLKVTTDIYGHWERAERKRQTEIMEGVFGV
jgi:integrase